MSVHQIWGDQGERLDVLVVEGGAVHLDMTSYLGDLDSEGHASVWLAPEQATELAGVIHPGVLPDVHDAYRNGLETAIRTAYRVRQHAVGSYAIDLFDDLIRDLEARRAGQ